MCEKLVSVVLSYYNDNKYLKESIESILNNDYRNIELVLLNHKTEDNCREIAHSYDDSRIIHLDMNVNIGGGSGILLSKMLNVTKGKYIKFMCADDILKSDGLKKLTDYLDKNQHIDFVFGNVEYVDENGKSLNENWFENRPYFSINNNEIDCIRLLMNGIGFLPWTGSLVKRSILSKIKINKTYVMMFDMSIWLSLLCKGYKIGYLNDVVTEYRIHSGQVSSIESSDKCAAFSYFEHKTFYEILYSCDNVSLAKKIFPNSRFSNLLSDKRDIPFFMAHNLFISEISFSNSVCYIEKMLNNDNSRNYLINKFGYGIKEYRDDIMTLFNKHKENHFNKDTGSSNLEFVLNNIKHVIYSTPSNNLNIMELLYLIVRRVFKIVTLRKIRQITNSKKKKKYTV